ncbi:hypothetical protein ACIBUQ_50585 [Nonomuraea sp. NPDC049377]|uniref:hypothetical protein n=1 Tax=Nonomuraea sp. NPDC049377 TaxID=3364351 RepID=UPI0037B392C3
MDQAAEHEHQQRGARGDFDPRPASQWRALEFAHDPADRRLFGRTTMQVRLAAAGWDNQGNGSTMAARAERGLISQGARPTMFGQMLTVTLTRAGRAAARAGLSLQPGPPRQAALSRRAWEVLALLWSADQDGEPLKWRHSPTIERVLIDKHVPPLAEHVGAGYGYEITARGRDFYREHHAAHAAAHPDVDALHPDGADAEPWPQRADDILAEHDTLYRVLCRAWRAAHAAQQQADTEAAASPPAGDDVLPGPVADQIAARHDLWVETARRRAALAAEHTRDLHQRATRAARDFTAAALAAFAAAAAGTDPLPALQPPSRDHDEWDEPRLAPPAETGIHVIDARAAKLYATAVGLPLKRRGPAPTRRRTSRLPPAAPPVRDPGHELAALSRFLYQHIQDGVLHRRLHPAS